MTRPCAALVALALAVLSVSCGSGNAGPSAGTAPLADTRAPVATAPEGVVSQVGFERFDGSAATLAEYAGRPLVVNFFARWCAPCVRELPDIERFHQTFGDQVAVLGVSVNERAEDGRELADATGVTFDIGRDPRGEMLKALGGAAMPTTALIDPSGRVVDVRSLPYTAEELEDAVREKLL
jgi:thiol-disulfide isomerase/thioredoxin